MKRNWLMRIGAAALVVGVMSMSMIGGTLAKYSTTKSGTGAATVAKWSFDAYEKTGGKGTFAVNLNDNDYGKVLPGTSGAFEIFVDASGSETDLDVEIAFDTITNKPANLKFYKELAHTTPIDLGTDKITNTIQASSTATDMQKTYTIYWDWALNATDPADTATYDANDLADQGKSMSFNITVTGTQVAPTTTTAAP